MGFPDRRGRARLATELLEDRITPTKLDAPALALPELTATGAVAADRVNVVMASETNSSSDAAALASAPFTAGVQSLGFGIYSVTLAPGTDLGAAVAYYSQFSGVLSAAPDEVVQLQQTPNDPRYSSLYGMTKIGAPAAWDVSTGTANFVVAVIDTGIDYNHPDLAANMWVNSNEVAGDGIDNDGNGYVDDLRGWDFVSNDNNPFDDNGHGTHVAGTIGAVGNNAVGVAGVNWSVKVMALKFLSASGSGYLSGAVAALNYAVMMGVTVSNNSWGGGGYSSTLASAIGRARDAGHIFVAAAGNSGLNIDNTPSYPASYSTSYDNVVAVAATGSTDALASWSNYGANAVALAAPGVSILSTTPNNTYSSYSGTSMAAPHVSGAIALYWGANPDLSYSDVIAKLESSVDVISGLAGRVTTGGRLNVGKMFATSPPPVVAPGPKVTAATYSGQVSTQFDTLNITFDRDVDASTFTAEDIVSFTGPNGMITTGYTISPASGSSRTFSVTFAAQTTAGAYSMVFGPDIRDTLGNPMNQDGDAFAGEESGDRFTANGSLVLTQTKTYDAGGLPKTIPDRKTITSSITIGDSMKISDLNVKVSLTHSYVSDLVITLTGPNGATVRLFNRRGGSGDNLSGTVFDDEAATHIANGAAPFSGSYRPEQALSAFDGIGSNGAWTLTISDKARHDGGTLTAWSLTVTGTVGGSGSGQATALGFLDQSAAPADDISPDSTVEPIVVAPAEPVSESAPPVAVEISTPPVFLFGTQAEREEELPVASEVRDDEEPIAGPLDGPRIGADPFAAAMATLYFPPDESEEGDPFGDF